MWSLNNTKQKDTDRESKKPLLEENNPISDDEGDPVIPPAGPTGDPESQSAASPDSNGEGSKETIPVAGESTQKNSCGCTIFLLVASLILGLLGIVIYILCYFRDNERYLQFFGHMSYRPSLLLPPLIWCAALVKIKFGDHSNRHTSWEKVFECEEGICNTFWNAMKVDQIISTIIYVLLPLGVFIVKLIYFIETLKECFGIILMIWFFTEIFGVLIFAIFFFWLYLKRLEVQKAFEKTLTIIRNNVGNFSACIIAIQRCFKQYYPLRSLMLPLLYFLLFESIFGITVFLSWSYNKEVEQSNLDSNTTSAPHWTELDNMCLFSCSAQDFNHLKYNLSYNLWIFLRHVMTILLPCLSASGIDMKYMWDDLTTELYFLYSQEHESFWEKITDYVKGIHPETSTYSILNIIVPVVALASGIFTGQQL